jgi:hypothetical protein
LESKTRLEPYISRGPADDADADASPSFSLSLSLYILSVRKERISHPSRLMAEAATAARKRPAPDGGCLEAATAAAAKKRAHYKFGRIQDYEKLEELGEGSCSVVFKVRDRRTGEKVAVKWIRGSGGGPEPDRSAVFREAGCHYSSHLLPRVPQALGEEPKALGEAFPECNTRGRASGDAPHGEGLFPECQKSYTRGSLPRVPR